MIDFAPHQQEFLRRDHAHRRLGFADAEIEEWFAAAGLEFETPMQLEGNPLTVVIWPARRAGAVDLEDDLPTSSLRAPSPLSATSPPSESNVA